MKEYNASIEELLPLLLEVIESGAAFRLYPRGTSMLPLLRQGIDSVDLVKPSVLKKGDICLFRRQNGTLVLHRIVNVDRDGTLSFRGDNQTETEQGITADQILACVARVYRGEKSVSPSGFFYRMTRLSAPARALRFRKRK